MSRIRGRLRDRVRASRLAAAWHVLRGRKVVFGLGRMDVMRDLDSVRLFNTTIQVPLDAKVVVSNCYLRWSSRRAETRVL